MAIAALFTLNNRPSLRSREQRVDQPPLDWNNTKTEARLFSKPTYRIQGPEELRDFKVPFVCSLSHRETLASIVRSRMEHRMFSPGPRSIHPTSHPFATHLLYII